ncbi:MarR family transcriptional regulator [Paenibacillus melissococcoides]|uniref:MarR family transcriptional regulator n=1 Tax=Paenibacillus melissococcoides TaxID=2912268 RepID=A0ABM9G7U2_9BACL|nr:MULTISPECIES: MarR family transcriptional regulator [Paenibacillus]MEB9896750.1 MarR family transcriptional regulator [Bacillus cereus]CAH8247995.1 MarR family transcriptional regulator [Paenibacillus melissococcoides]CAH8718926.1 MarR family transcriptional regulator [Paenibacillus melissococcoides]CAH8719931.1 MarR family transcriptional regulator [Paenibacillus melissococcoides]GIO80692.1 organic hydroperoxide resistance transcriptional regulator [Paenibacillus dendritiformis]
MTTSHPLPPDERLKLDNQLCFAIYAASRELTKLYRPLLERLELTYPQYLALLALWEHDGMTVKELGLRLYLDSGTLTPMLKRMEQQGLIRRARAAEDERKVILSLTGKGHSLKKEAACIPAQLAELADGARLDPGRLLHDIRALLEHLSQHPPQRGE